MPTNTAHYNLVKPDGDPGGDLVDITILDANLDTIDDALHNHDLADITIDGRLDTLEASKTKLALETSVSGVAATGAIVLVETTILTLPSVTYDGTTEVELLFSWYNAILTVTTDTFFLHFYDGATLIGTHLLVGTGAANIGGGTARTRFTPDASAHAAMTVKAVRNSGTGTLVVSAGGTTPMILSARPCP